MVIFVKVIFFLQPDICTRVIGISVIMEPGNTQSDLLNNISFANLKPVSFTSTQAFDGWNRFKKKINWTLDGMNKATEKKKVALLMSRIGDEGIDVYEQFELVTIHHSRK